MHAAGSQSGDHLRRMWARLVPSEASCQTGIPAEPVAAHRTRNTSSNALPFALADLEKHTATEKLCKKVKAHILMVAGYTNYDVLTISNTDFTPTWLDTWLPAWAQNKLRSGKGGKQIPLAAPICTPGGQQTTCLALEAFSGGQKNV